MNPWTLRAHLGNRGTARLPAGISGTFYSSGPGKPNPQVICTATSTMPLVPGGCEMLQCDWKNPPQTPVDLWFRGDDDGSGKMSVPECKPMNDLLYLPNAACMKIG